MDTTFLVKILLMVVFFLEVTIFGNFVSSLKCFTNKKIMDLAMTFSGTLFLSIALVDVIPEAITSFDQYFSQQNTEQQSSNLHKSKLPLTMIIALGTFMMIMWLDKIMISHSHDHQYRISFVQQPRKQDQANFAGQKQLENSPHKKIHDQVAPSQRRQILQLETDHNHSKSVQNLKPYILQLGMSIHAFFETLAVGLQQSTISVLSLATAILVHKWAQGLTLGLLYKKQGFKRKTIFVMITLQGLVNVLGLLAGSFLMSQGNFVMAFFMSMSAGTFIYISLVQVLQQQIKNFNKLKLLMVIAANLFIVFIVWLEKKQQASQ